MANSQISKVLALVRPYKKPVILNIVLNVLGTVFTMLSVVMFMPVLDMLFNQELSHSQLIKYTQFSWADFHWSMDYLKGVLYQFMARYILDSPTLFEGKMKALIFTCGIVVVSFLFKNIFKYLALYFLTAVRSLLIRDYRQKIYNKLLALDVAFLSNQKKGEVLSKMTSDVQEIEWAIAQGLEAYFRDSLGILITFALLFSVNGKLTLFALVFLPVSGGIIARVGKSLRKSSMATQEKMGRLLAMMEETISGVRIIKSFTAERFAEERFFNTQQDYTQTQIRMARKRDLASPLSEFLGVLAMTVIIAYGGSLVFQDELAGTEFLLFVGLFYNLITHIKAFSTAFFYIKKGMSSVERINTILETPVSIKQENQAKAWQTFEKEITFNNICFAYKENQDVLKNISFTLQKGKTIALVGQSGSGKSTIAQLLPRFYDVTSGEICVDGTDLRKVQLTDLRDKIGLVAQDNILFNDSIYNNIAFGLPNANPKAVEEAAKMAHCHDFIMEMPENYQTNIGDGGNKLSGGQRQRLAIARALLKNPSILILDEATSALDTESEKMVQQALETLMQSRTCLVIAHRLSTVVHADEILVMEKGEIIERGTHQALLDKGGIYHKLYTIQSQTRT